MAACVSPPTLDSSVGFEQTSRPGDQPVGYRVERLGNDNWRSPTDTQWPPKDTDASIALGFGGTSGPRPTKIEAKTVELFYATTRDHDPGPRGTQTYSARRSSSVKYGLCYVSIPPTHRRAAIERPYTWFFSETPALHFTLARVAETDEKFALSVLRTRLKQFSQKQVLIYVHGHATSFAESAYRAAQLKFDLDFSGQVLFFSWPVSLSSSGYGKTSNAVEWETAYLKEVLSKLLQQGDIHRVVIITHSAGANLGAHALKGLVDASGGSKIEQLILASPDIDKDVFERDLAPSLSVIASRTTIYGSNEDRALSTSSWWSDSTRLGEAQRSGTSTKIDFVDTSAVTSGLLGHSDYAEAPVALADLSLLVDRSMPPEKRPGLTPIGASFPRGWFLTNR